MRSLLYIVGLYVMTPFLVVVAGAGKKGATKLLKNIGKCRCRVCEQYAEPIH